MGTINQTTAQINAELTGLGGSAYSTLSNINSAYVAGTLLPGIYQIGNLDISYNGGTNLTGSGLYSGSTALALLYADKASGFLPVGTYQCVQTTGNTCNLQVSFDGIDISTVGGYFDTYSGMAAAQAAGTLPEGRYFAKDKNAFYKFNGTTIVRIDNFSVLDFNADPTGVNDSYAAWTSAIAALPINGGRIYVPAGVWNISAVPSYGTKSIYWDIDVGATFTGAGCIGVGGFPSSLANTNIKAVGPFIRSQSTTAVAGGHATATNIIETIQPQTLAGGVISQYSSVWLNSSATGSIATACNLVATANPGSSGNLWGLEIDLANFSDVGTQFGISLITGGANNLTFGLKTESITAARWTTGIYLRHCINGIYVDETGGSANNCLVLTTPPSLYPNTTAIIGQIANGGTALLMHRKTDTAPTGFLINLINQTNTQSLFSVDVNGNAAAQTIYSDYARRKLVFANAANYTVGTETHIVNIFAGAATFTLPVPNLNVNREIYIRTVTAFTISSASTNVSPLAGGANTTAILAATTGKWTILVSDGTSWQQQAGN